MIRLKFPGPIPALFSPNTPGPAPPQPWLPLWSGHRLWLCCQRCGRRWELPFQDDHNDIVASGREYGFLVVGSRREVFGLCARCRGLK